MYRILASLLFIACLCAEPAGTSSKWQAVPGTAQPNGCVSCHARLSAPADVIDRFLDWRASKHGTASITCDKCHGGDPTASDQAKAHRGVLSPSHRDSRLHQTNSPATCAGCHPSLVRSFVESKHYLLLKTRDGGPSCISCHGHMTSCVARAPAEGNALCTFCHNVIDGPLPQRPDIVRKAKSTLDAIARTKYLLAWIDELLDKARTKKINVKSEEEALRGLKLSLSEAKADWHTFSLETPSAKAAKSFDEAVRIKDSLSVKLGGRTD